MLRQTQREHKTQQSSAYLCVEELPFNAEITEGPQRTAEIKLSDSDRLTTARD